MFRGEKIETYGFETDVFPKELEDIRERLVARGGGETAAPRGEGLPDFAALMNPDDPPSNVLQNVIEDLSQDDNEKRWQDDATVPHKGLVGLAFSGGGIRSATFNLGVMQALKKMGLFKCVDYLSTVSGGGYIGSCISSTLASINKPAYLDTLHEPVNQIFDHTQGRPEPNIFRHLRDNANYLAPDGLRDILRIPALLFRGIVVNFLVILPYVLAAAVLTLLIKPTGESLGRNVFRDVAPDFLGGSFVATKGLLLLLILLFAGYPALHMYAQKLTLGERSNWNLRNRFGRFLGFFVALIIAVAFIEIQPFAIRFIHGFGDYFPAITAGLGTVSTAFNVFFADKLLAKLSNIYGRLAFYIIGLLGFGFLWAVYLWLCALGVIWGPDDKVVFGLSQGSLLKWYGSIAAVLWLYTFVTVDVNFTGIHKFYRDRLSKAYIVGLKQPKEGPFTNTSLSTYSVVHTDDVKLSGLNTRHGPYHLINALLNLNRQEEEYKTGRHGDFFVFSKNYIGGEITGYCRTQDLEGVSRHIDLAMAMAISGAAAAANMGKLTVKPLIFILAMLNVRLNYWFPNPKKGWRKSEPPEWLPESLRPPAGVTRRVGPVFLLKEMFGLNSDEDWYINLSDGGHIENLGVYELIRRQCRLIIVGDGESDASLKFQGLADLIRMVQIDMGIKIEIDGLDEIRRGEQHHAIGTIHYPEGRIGKLIYLKSSLLGDNNLIATLDKESYITSPYRDDDLMFDENAYIASYKARNSAFPHQSTGDQFFDEAQFECYRALGYAVTMDALRAKR